MENKDDNLGDSYTHSDDDDDEMIKFRFKDVSVSVSVTTIVSGEDTTECFISSRKKREAERMLKDQEEAKQLAKLEETKALVAEINAAMEEEARLLKEKERQEIEEKRRADAEAAALAISLAAKLNTQKSRPSTATKRIKVSVVDEEARERELLQKRLEEEEAQRRKQLEEEKRLAEERVRAVLYKLRQKAAARCIQRIYRAHVSYLISTSAVVKLQRFARRWRIMRRWWGIVGHVLHLAALAAISIQKRYRGYKAREATILTRLNSCSNCKLQEADYWMNVHILSDYRFALGRSFISEGRKGYYIGGRNDDFDSPYIGMETENISLADDDSACSDESNYSSSSEEEDYIINQRLNKHKVTEDDIFRMETFVHNLFHDDSLSYKSQVFCSGALEELNELYKIKVGTHMPWELKCGGKWAAQLMHMLEFLPPPPLCIKPLELILRILLLPKSAEDDLRVDSFSYQQTARFHTKIDNDEIFGDMLEPSSSDIVQLLEGLSSRKVVQEPECNPPIYALLISRLCQQKI